MSISWSQEGYQSMWDESPTEGAAFPSLMERFYSEVEVARTATTRNQESLLSFLATAQALGIPIQPIMWQSAQQAIGAGGTSRIDQALADIRTSLAFKRVKNKEKREKPESDIFLMLTNEITVLGHPFVREDPTISQLQALCWEVDKGKVWPVLVFEKSQYGDLNDFMKVPAGNDLDLRQRIGLCNDVGNAVAVMHACNIVHGDIKPSNVLVFRLQNGNFRAKVTDFGYSTRYADADHPIRMPLSQPWSAPEHARINQQWTPAEAKKMDLFSYGVFSLWVLFRDRLSEATLAENGDPSSSRRPPVYSDQDQAISTLMRAKERKELPLLAQKLLEAEPSLDIKWKKRLRKLFDSILNHNPNQRDLARFPLPTDRIPQMDLNVSDTGFKIEVSLLELYGGDYRVRSYIVACLEQLYDRSLEDPTFRSPANIAFQLALCYKIGFGIRRDERRSTEILQNHGLNQIDLQSAIDEGTRTNNRLLRAADAIVNLMDQNHLPTIEFPSYYQEQGVLHEATFCLIREAEDLQSTLGSDSDITIKVQATLLSIFEYRGRHKEAEELAMQVMETRKKTRGAEHPRTLDDMQRVAWILFNQGRWQEAIGMQMQVVKSETKIFGVGHAHTLTSMYNLAYFYWKQGRWQEAELLELQVLETRKDMLGHEHPKTLLSISRFLPSYLDQKRWKEAEELLMHLTGVYLKFLGAEHIDTLRSAATLALVCRHQGHIGDAKEVEAYFIQPATLQGQANLALTYLRLGRLEKSEELGRLIVEAAGQNLGAEHPATIQAMTSLALTYIELGKWKEAEKLEAIEKSAKVHGPTDQETFHRMHLLAEAYKRKGRWKETEKLFLQMIEIKRAALGADHLETARWMLNLAVLYGRVMRCKEAERLCRQVTEIREHILGPEHPATLASMSNLSAAIWDAPRGRKKEAERICKEVLEIRKRVMGSEHPDTLDSLLNLAAIHAEDGRWKDTEELETQVVEARSRVLGREHPKTLSSMDKLAHTYWRQGRREEALRLLEAVQETWKKEGGDEHPDTVERMETLERWRRQVGGVGTYAKILKGWGQKWRR